MLYWLTLFIETLAAKRNVARRNQCLSRGCIVCGSQFPYQFSCLFILAASLQAARLFKRNVCVVQKLDGLSLILFTTRFVTLRAEQSFFYHGQLSVSHRKASASCEINCSRTSLVGTFCCFHVLLQQRVVLWTFYYANVHLFDISNISLYEQYIYHSTTVKRAFC